MKNLMKSLSTITLVTLAQVSLTSCVTDDTINSENDKLELSEKKNDKKKDLEKFNIDKKTGTIAFEADVVYFGFDDTVLTEDGQTQLIALGKFLKKNDGVKISIEGHADMRGSSEYNLALGDRRAHVCKDFLVSIGVNEARLNTLSFGEEQPAENGETENAWSKNRRAEFKIANLKESKEAVASK